MEFPIPQPYKQAILRQYYRNLAQYPLVLREIEDYLQEKEESFSLCMRYLYGHMAAQDILSASANVFAGYVRATMQALQQLDYLQTVPPDIFFPYVLYHRVNSECLDDSRGVFLKELLPHVQGKTMERAALSVNYWCYAHATYTPADDRTLGPLAVLRRTMGRCGEESVLAVAALRSVGIPARQCYCPRWSHCDDNHAWVEVWIDGDWHYLGACEPEPVLDRGWFTAAASRAMLVDTKCWADWENDALYKTVNCTARYTPTQMLTIHVTDHGQSVSGATVRFQVVNYSELYTLWEDITDEHGLARFETGPGDLFVYARFGQKVALQKVDLRQQNTAVLALQADFPEQITLDLVPPADSSGVVPFENSLQHQALLERCENHLAQRRAGFMKDTDYLHHAALNYPEIQAFLEDSSFSDTEKEALLYTLRPKDFVDISRSTLEDALQAAAPAQEHYPPDIFRNCVLAPRIADEMLLSERQKIRRLFPQGFANPEEVHRWMAAHMQVLPDNGTRNYYPSVFGCLRCRQVPAFAFDMVFVALCRAFCFPAILEPHTQKAVWIDTHGIRHSIHPQEAPVRLKLLMPAGIKLNYSEHITIGVWDGSDFTTLRYSELPVENGHTFTLQPGFYRVTVTTRQIDGTASVTIRHFMLSQDITLWVTQPEDQTVKRLRSVPPALPEGPLKARLAQDPARPKLLIYADPGSEPTEHLLQEMLTCAADFRCLPCWIFLFTATEKALEHPTVQLVKAAIPTVTLSCLRDPEALAALHLQMQVGDLRLPFAVCMDSHGRGAYAAANYQIRMAQTLLKILQLLAE